MRSDILITGLARQGGETAARVLANAAMTSELRAKIALVPNGALPGESLCAQVRIGDSFSPFIPTGSADFLLGLEPGEAVRALERLSPAGRAVVSVNGAASDDGKGYDPDKMTAYLKKNVESLYLLDTDALCRRAGEGSMAWCVLLGAAAKLGVGGISPFVLLDVLKTEFAGELYEINKKAYLLGAMSVDR